MNTNAVAHAPAVQGHGRPDKAEKAGKAMETGTQTTTATAVEITLSEDAQAAMTEDGAMQGPGKSANSPAHQARAMLAEGRVGEDYKNFGQLVSSIARGLDVTGQEGGEEDDSGDGVGDDMGDGTVEAPVADGPDETSDPSAPAADDTAAAPVDETSEDEVVEEIVQPAEETAAEDPAAPVADPVVDPIIDPAIDPVAVEDELLDALDKTLSEET